ncbi:hypothetical protein SAMN05444411_102480 [Lutibacter oricola]|uniref:LTXXQ motif family protein n=1 Tax=Lutibacter oricola TaxID=762486 RepID=A0A1H2XIJ0_9FLAO|nr:hypothetical protein [Lutibacter oricola]SDW92662.1 hypothetical protein SAMN05444411_102480 [Lutibacter oricola]
MKKIKLITVLFVGLIVGIATVKAQKKDNIEPVAIENLSTEQQKLMLKQKQLIKQNRETFKASLTSKQLSILENTTLSKKEKQNALMVSLSKQQQLMLKTQRENIKVVKDKLRNSITTEQRQQIRARLRVDNNFQNNKELRERMKERRKERIKDIKKGNGTGSGGGKGTGSN